MTPKGGAHRCIAVARGVQDRLSLAAIVRVMATGSPAMRSTTAAAGPSETAAIAPASHSPQHDPGRRVVTGVDLTADMAVDPGVHQAAAQRRAEQEVIDAQPASAPSGSACSARTCTSARRDGARGSRRSSPGRAGAGTPPGSPAAAGHRWPRTWSGDVQIGRDDVVVAGQHRRHAGGMQLARMGDQPLEPGELVVEFGPGYGLPFGR